ncbi:MAG: hypothetical protein IJ375_06540 [Oscillospiraceae bacterium]|nr:hypothetical protein [Oscillospiraceae bacterium]
MKKLISMALAVTMVLAMLAGCAAGGAAETTEAPTEVPTETSAAPQQLEGSVEDLLNQIIEKNPVEFAGGVIPVDLTDTSEEGLWALKAYTGLDSAEGLLEAAAYEPMMGSIAFSLVMVRLDEGTDARTVAQAMRSGIDTRKWICVEADQLMVCTCGDLVMLLMLNSDSGMTTQSFVEAFQAICTEQLGEGMEIQVY